MEKKQCKKIIFIAGPTAIGKTAVGISLAKRLGGEVVSCDSMQVYEGIQIASNKPLVQEMKEVPHHLIGFVSLSQSFDVVQFQKKAYLCIQDIVARGKIPIVVGGTGMYMKVLLDGIFEEQDDDGGVRQTLDEELLQKGAEAMYQELSKVDPVAAQKIHMNDERRVRRALEVFRLTGKPISQLQKVVSGLWGEGQGVEIFGLTMERQALYGRIERRVEQMFDQGLIEEVRTIQDVSLSKTAEAIIGIKEVGAYLLGEWILEKAKEEMKKNTRRLAKRQLTWFRAEDRLQWIEINENEGVDQIAERILERLG